MAGSSCRPDIWSCAGARSFRLSEDGGAVLLQNPDGSEALMLLVSDIKRAREDLAKRERAAKAARDQAPPGTYEVGTRSPVAPSSVCPGRA